MESPRQSEFATIAVCIIVLGYMLFAFVSILRMAPVNVDAGYYLLVGRLISEGLIPFKDFEMLYPPLPVYIFSIPFRLFGRDCPYEAFLLIVQLFNLLSGCLLFQILKQTVSAVSLRIVIASLFVSFSYNYEAEYIVLEPIALAFVLLAFLLCLRSDVKHINIFLAGIAAAIGLLCKQYVVLALPVLLTQITLNARFGTWWVRATCFLLGLLIPLLLTVNYFIFFHSVTVQQILWQLSAPHFKSYEFKLGILAEAVGGSLFFSIILGIPLLAFLLTRQNRNYLLVNVLFVFAFALQYLIRSHSHYIILLLPFLLIIFSEVLAAPSSIKSAQDVGVIYLKAVIFSWFALQIYFTNTCLTQLAQAGRKELQLETKQQLATITSDSNRAIVLGSPAYFFLLNLKPPSSLFQIILSIHEPETAIRIINTAPMVIIIPWEQSFYQREVAYLADRGYSLADWLSVGGLKLQKRFDNNIEVWSRTIS